MVKKVTLIRIFVASPGDVKMERESLDQVINEINLVIGRSKGIQLELVKWETHAYSSIGDDTQEVINEQINDEYDIFIGILWKRLGSKTPREKSGTIEEFNRAYSRHKKNPDNIRVMFYFNESLISPKDIDPKQLVLIQQFQNKLRKIGVLYWSYTELNDFINLVRMHLSQHINEFGKSWGLDSGTLQTNVVTNQENKKEIQKSDEEKRYLDSLEFAEEEGYFELIEIGTKSFNKTTEITNHITQIILELTKNIISGTKDLTKLEKPFNIKQTKRIVDRTAEDLDHFATRMRTEIPKLSEHYNRGINSYGRIAELWLDFGIEDKSQIVNAFETVNKFKTSLLSTKKSATEFRENINNWPRITTKLIHAKRNSIAAIDEFIDDLTRYINMTDAVKNSIEQIIEAD